MTSKRGFRAVTRTLRLLFEKEFSVIQHDLAATNRLLEGVAFTHGDRRVDRARQLLEGSATKLNELGQLCREDLLPKIERVAESFGNDFRVLVKALTGVLENDSSKTTPGSFCRCFLDQVMAVLPAEKGYLVHYQPATSEAEVLAARNFDTTHLGVEEYNFSRGLLRRVFETGQPLVIENALADPHHSMEISVKRGKIKSVIIVPFKSGKSCLGAVYLENQSIIGAFDQDHRSILEALASLVCFYLVHARWLPLVRKRQHTTYLDETRAHDELIGRDPAMLTLFDQIEQILDKPVPVLIKGETGTGKEKVARALHYESSRRKKHFVAVNCAAIPNNLLESELFGHEKGAFTGAVEQRIGLIEEAQGGTLFLDEIHELAMPLQPKLLRFLQENEITRVGGNRPIQIKTHVVAAMGQDLGQLIKQGKFLDALYYRLNVVPLEVPPLRKRKSDVPLLIRHFTRKYANLCGEKSMEVDPVVDDLLMQYSFPGNVRELENIIQRMMVFCSGNILSPDLLPKEVLQMGDYRVAFIARATPKDLDELDHWREEAETAFKSKEKALIARILTTTGGNVSEAAKRLCVHRTTLHRLLKRHRISRSLH